MNFKEIQELIKLVDKSHLTEFKLKEGEFEIVIRTDKYVSGKAIHASPATYVAAAPAVIPAASPQTATTSQEVTQATAQATTSTPAAPTAGNEEANYIPVKASMVGTFYRSPGPDKSAFVKVGDIISKGSVLCIIEAMKLFNEIESDVSGKIVKVVAEDASPVEFDQVLFLVDPNG
ncbi:MAG: acetyl-CoA carboxylase biotin carboxyl carrier protein [Saprospiraceae bacterium]|nr:acetyl-CoA carboxylase biotin carboxyl carrier protein [Saprospiraceae bacterium]MBP7679785.1 acetyl-CoA carboxylase biotin carboxyl carrier protein [Saprospiraceae bacterium]